MPTGNQDRWHRFAAIMDADVHYKPDPPDLDLEQRWRAIGKLCYGHSYPTVTIAYLDREETLRIAGNLVYAGVWSEFYVKEVWTRPGHQEVDSA